MGHSQFDTDALFEILANEPRRRLLADLSERPARRVELPAGRSVAAEALERTPLELHHVHLPKLQAAGLVRWDRDADGVSEGPRFERTRPVLELLAEHAEKLPSGWV